MITGQRAFPFATIGFRPFRETGEFVTVGVVVYDPTGLTVKFQFEDGRRTGRITGLFPKLELGVFRAAMESTREELAAVQKSLRAMDTPMFPAGEVPNTRFFENLTGPTEGMICYPVKGRRMAADLDEAVAALFQRYVRGADLVPQLRVEEEMTRKIERLFEELHVKQVYKPDVSVGDEHYRVRFTFGHYPVVQGHQATLPDRVIRPLNFDREDSTDVYRLGDEWISRLRRLRQFDCLPERCILTLREPATVKERTRAAYQEVERELEKERAICIPENDEAKLAEFIRLDEPGTLALAG